MMSLQTILGSRKRTWSKCKSICCIPCYVARLLTRAYSGAKEALTEYFKSIGGRPEKPATKSGPGRKRKSMGETKSTSATPSVEPKKRRRSTKAQDLAPEAEAEVEEDEEETTWVPKGKNWDKELDSVDTIIRDQESGGLFAFLLWNNGKRSKVSIESCYEKCPRKVSLLF